MNKHITIHSSDPAAFYFGRWQVDGIRRFTVSAYSRCFFQFAGNAVRFQARTGPAQGICEVWLDGEFQALADCYAPEPGEAWVFEKAGLAGEKIHHLTVIAKPEQNAKARGNGFEPLAFAAPQPVDYPAELRRRMEKEYGLITAGQKGWKDPAEWRPVPYRAEMPRRGVSLLPGMVRQTFDANIKNLKRCASLPGFCEGKPMEWLGEGWQGPGWSSWLPASNEGRMLAGAAGVLRWEEDPELRAIVDGIIAGIKGRMREDGYFNYYPEELSYGKDHSLAEWKDDTKIPGNDAQYSERKNYDRVFWTRGMIAAILAGNPDAPELLRRMYDWFNRQEKYLPRMLLGGNATNGTPGGPLVYHSPAGRPDDLITSMRYFDQDYWFQALAEGQPLAFSHYPGERPHCYALLPVETLADEYRATGDGKYLAALLGAWDIYSRYYKHAGGPTAICEMHGPYPPGTRYITTGHNGETCGHVFWMWINERLAQLYPEEEKYIAEIEEAIYNTLCNCRDDRGYTRYHIRLHGKKDGAGNSNTCCQVSSTMAISALPQYVYMTGEDALLVNLFIPSTFDSPFGRVSMETEFPASGKVSIRLDPKAGAGRFSLSVRIPRWAAGPLTLRVNNSPAGEGSPGERLTIRRRWEVGDTVSFTIPIGFSLVRYTGTDQAPDNRPRYTLLYGPLLMALKAPECRDPETIPRLRIDSGELPRALKPQADNPLHFPVPGTAYTYMPYRDAGEEGFTCLPVIHGD